MKVGLIGTFDVENFGDCMFPELYATLLEGRFGKIEIALYSPLPHAAEILSFDQVHALPDHESPAHLASLDADTLILIGGETIGYGHSAGTFNFPRNTLSAYLRLWLAPILATRNPDLRPSFFAVQSVGAIKMPAKINHIIATCMAAADRVRFRDPYSADWIQTENIFFKIEIDPMFLIDRVCSPMDWRARAIAQLPGGIEPEAYLAVQVSLGYADNELNAWVESVAQIAKSRNLAVILVPICHFMQDELLLAQLEKMLRKFGVRVHLMRGRRNVKDTASLIGMSAGYIGSSLHGAVTAVAFARPLAVLGHSEDGKHAGTLSAVGITNVVTTQSICLPNCFAHSESSDNTASRRIAQTQAQTSVNGLFDAIEASNSEAYTKRFHVSTLELIAAERRPRFKVEAKRLILRVIGKISWLAKLHRFYSRKKAFRGIGR